MVIISPDNGAVAWQSARIEGAPAMTSSTAFTNNRSQAVRLPADARLPLGVKRVEVRVRGRKRISAPVRHVWDSFFNDGPGVTPDFMAKRAQQMQPARETL
jgi:antitoxin VapB